MVAEPRDAERVRRQRPRAGRAGRDRRARRRPGDRQRAVRGDRPPHPPPAPFGASAVTAATDIGMLLVNLGTPAAPEPEAVRRYLAAFLSDRRVVEIPPARKSVVWGKRVSVRVDLGGRRIIKQKKH